MLFRLYRRSPRERFSVILVSMNLLSINNLSRMGREEPLFTDVTFGLDEGDKAAVLHTAGVVYRLYGDIFHGLTATEQGHATV